ncbi:MAG: hypothetical protein V2J07_01980 [Anaerolineae bacterium]|jgi:hypothetical protein|nr:hypothetical protein [Anaerolineae bacterium]
MIDHVTYYYRTDTPPFQSLSGLPKEEAIAIMRTLADDSNYGARFKDPEGYMSSRKAAEGWVRQAFIAKGGKPHAEYPIAMVLGESPWLVRSTPDINRHGELRIPLSIFNETDISFTYPDSMISYWFGQEQPAGLYHPELHGHVFLRSEILAIIAERGMPEGSWNTHLPDNLAPYIEAQVWNHELLEPFRNGAPIGKERIR